MKTIRLTILLLFCPLVFFAQTLTGLWIGSVNNDSTTIRKDQSFEIVLTQYKDKVYGYSRSTFIVNDSLFYIVKRVKGTIEGDICEVKDDDIVSYNFKGRLDKGVKMVSTFRFDHNDSVWRMDGDWKTNKTKKYYSVSGKIALAQEKNLDKSKIFPHLEELKLADEVAFYKESKKISEPVAASKQPAKDNAGEKPVKKEPVKQIPAPETKSESTALARQPGLKNNPSGQEKKDEQKANAVTIQSTTQPKQPETFDQKDKVVTTDQPSPASNKESKAEVAARSGQPVSTSSGTRPSIVEKKPITVDNIKKDNEALAQTKPVPAVQTGQPGNESKKQIPAPDAAVPTKKSDAVAVTKPVEQKKDVIIETSKTTISTKEDNVKPAVIREPEKQKPVTVIADVRTINMPTAAEFVTERKVAAPQVVNYQSDSLELVLYDNGEIDGDTVSVLLNGELILAKQGLKASAIKKMIYTPTGKDDDMTLVLYAENLGKYPPNTGLLIVHDGEDTYQIRFSADFQQNAAVIFKRKKN